MNEAEMMSKEVMNACPRPMGFRVRRDGISEVVVRLALRQGLRFPSGAEVIVREVPKGYWPKPMHIFRRSADLFRRKQILLFRRIHGRISDIHWATPQEYAALEFD